MKALAHVHARSDFSHSSNNGVRRDSTVPSYRSGDIAGAPLDWLGLTIVTARRGFLATLFGVLHQLFHLKDLQDPDD